MKTKHLMMAMALPVAFAACSQEEIVTENSASDALKGRKEIGQITLTTGDESRWAVNAAEGFNAIRPDALDGFAAMLVDAPKSYEGNHGWENLLNDQHNYAVDNYYITPFISTNYKFEKNGTSWTSKASMVEGHYVFMAPFNADQKTRTVAKSILPTKQQLKFKADGKTIDPLSAINDVVANGKTVFYLGHRFLDADVTTASVPVNFYHLYAYPEITIENPTQGETGANSNPVTVTQVVLEKDGEGFVIDATFNNKGLVNKMMNEVFAAKGADTKTQALRGAWASATQLNFGFGTLSKTFAKTDVMAGQAYSAAVQNAYDLTIVGSGKQNYASAKGLYTNGLTAKTSEVLNADGATSKYIIIDMPAGGVTLQPGEKFSFNAVIPAETYNYAGGTGLTLWAVMKSDGQQIMAYKTTPASHNTGLTINTGKRYPQEDYANYNLKNDAKGNYFTIRTREDVKGDLYTYSYETAPFAGVVSTTEELKNFILNNQSQNVLNITTYGDAVRYNKAVQDAIAMNGSQKVNIAGPITIDAEKATLTVSAQVEFNEAVATNGAIVMNNSIDELVVLEDASVTFGGSAAAQVTNLGTLTLKNIVAVVDNYNVLNVAAAINAANINNIADKCDDVNDKYLHNNVVFKPSVNVLAQGGNYSIEGVIDYPITVAAHATNPGVLTLADDITFAQSLTQKGTITNNGTVTAASAVILTVPGEFTAKNMTTGVFAANVAIVIEGIDPAWSTTDWATTGFEAYTDRATFENGGTIKGAVTVDGFLKMTDNNARLEGAVDGTAGENGEIDNTVAAYISAAPTNAKVFAVVTGGLTLDAAASSNAIDDLVAKYETTYSNSKVAVIRIASAVSVSGAYSATVGATVNTIEFADGAKVSFLTDNAVATLTGWTCTLTGASVQLVGRATANTISGATFDKGEIIRWVRADNAYKKVEGTATATNAASPW